MVISGNLGTVASIPSADSASRGLSAGLWKNVKAQYHFDFSRGLFVREDFACFDVAADEATQFYAEAPGQYNGYLDSGATIAQVEGDFGICRLATDTTNEDECVLRFGSDTTVLGAITDTAGSKAVTIFEARVRTNSIVDGVAGLLIGMCQANIGSAADELTDASADLASIDFIGFKADEDDGDQFDTVVRKAGAAETAVGTDVVSGGVAASTWIKLGFGYFPNHPDGGRVVFSVDGTILDDVVSESFGSTFPDGDYLTPIFGIRNDAGSAAKQLDIDWWAFYQSSDLE